MSGRPGYTSRFSGCFLIVFFGIFGAFGGGFLYALLFMPDNVSGSVWVGAVVSSVFLLIGLVGVFAGFRVLFGKPALGGTVTHAADKGRYYQALMPYNMHKLALQPGGYYRVPPESTHRGKFFMLAFAAVFWNGIVGVFVVQKLSGSDGDSAPWWFLAIFLLIGLGILFGAVKALFRWIMVGETQLDVSVYPVAPGQRLDVLVSQSGRFKIDQVRIDLVCEEKASYRQGTDTHTKTEIVREVAVCELPGMTARDGRVLAHQTAQVPADAMVSFKASNNEINWLVRVKMVLPGRPDVEQRFPLVVVPERVAQEVLRGAAASG